MNERNVDNSKTGRWITAAFICLQLLVTVGLFADSISQYGVIKSPVPNLTESKYTELEKIAEVGADLGNGRFLFNCYSVTVDAEDNLYVFDDLQTTIFKFDKDLKYVTSFGKRGEGKGEIICDQGYCHVVLNVGVDGNLYVNVNQTKTILVFDKDGKFLRRHKYNEVIDKPQADKAGNIISGTIEKDLLTIANEKKGVIYSSPIKDFFNKFLFFLPDREFLHVTSDIQTTLIRMELMKNSKMMIYVNSSSYLLLFDGNKLEKAEKVWPRQALLNTKKIFQPKYERDANCFRPIFIDSFSDYEAERFYLAHGLTTYEGKPVNALYEFDSDGDFKRVLYVEADNGKPTTIKFACKANGKYYVIDKEKIKIYKEKV